MDGRLQRRTLLAGMVAGAATVIVGYSKEARAWVPRHRGNTGNFDHVPALDGELLTDPAARGAFGEDLGFAVFTTPRAVLKPASIDDVKAMVRFCRKRRIRVAARGQGHSTNGQSQVDGGLVIDTSTLATIHEIGDGYVVVDAGSTWRNLLEATLLEGQTPPVLTGFIGLSIGGTLSMGGISGMAYNVGMQVEQVEELTVVTGRGDVKECSRTKNRRLFDAVLAGIGQYAIIVRAKLLLVRAEERALDLTLRYDDADLFLSDMRTLMMRAEFDMVWGGAAQDENGWYYQLFTTNFYTPPDYPDVDFMLRDLLFVPAATLETDGTYFEYQTRVDNLIAFLRSINAFDGLMHPWFDVFLPQSESANYVESVLPSLEPDDVGNNGFVLFFPLFRATIQRPLLRLPDDEIVVLFDILTSANFPGFDADYAERMRQRNTDLYEAAKAVGATRYPIGSLDFTREDWREHYGPQWRRVLASKRAFDPQHILAPSVGIFPD